MKSTEERLQLLELKVAHLEGKALFTAAQNKSETIWPAQTVSQAAGQAAVEAQPANSSKSTDFIKNLENATKQGAAQPSSSSASALGLIGVVCFIFASVYLVRLALDSGWLTPVRQIILALTFGFSLIAGGYLMKDRDREYSSYLPAAGIVVLFLTVFGATNIYSLLSFQTGTIASVAIGVLCLFLYQEFDSGIYQIIAGIGSYLMPFLMSGETNPGFTQVGFVIVSVTFTAMAVFLDARSISLLSAYLAIGATSLLPSDMDKKIIFTFVQFLIFTLGVVIHSVKNRKPLKDVEAYSFFPLILFFYGVQFSHLSQYSETAATLFAVGLSVFLLLCYFFASSVIKTEETFHSGDVAFSSMLLMLVHSFYFLHLTEILQPAVFVGLAFAYLSVRKMVPAKWTLLSKLLQIVLALLCVWNFGLILMLQFGDGAGKPIWAAYGALMALGLMALSQNEFFAQSKRVQVKHVLGLAHLMAISSIYTVAEPVGSLAVSLAWAVYALAILVIGYQRRDALFTKSSVGVLLICTFKVLIYDTSDSGAGVRIVCLIVTGALLYFSGFIFRRIETWK